MTKLQTLSKKQRVIRFHVPETACYHNGEVKFIVYTLKVRLKIFKFKGLNTLIY